MFDLLVVIIQWLAGVLRCGERFAGAKLVPVPVRTNAGPCRGDDFSACSTHVGWMTLRLDPVSQASWLSLSWIAQDWDNLRALDASERGLSCSFGSSAALKVARCASVGRPVVGRLGEADAFGPADFAEDYYRA